MATFTRLLRTAALSAVLGTALTVAPVAYAAGVGGGSHGGGFAGGGFHGGGFHGGGFHGGVGTHGGGFRGGVALHSGSHRGRWQGRYDGYWQDGAWVDGWSPYCDPNSPLYDLNDCYGD